MDQILLAYGLLKDTIAATIMLYKNMRINIRSPDGDMDYFDIVAGVLQGDTLAPYLFIIYLDYVLQMSIELMKIKWLHAGNKKKRRYSVQTIMDADYANGKYIHPNRIPAT